jgi:hypothetical protein
MVTVIRPSIGGFNPLAPFLPALPAFFPPFLFFPSPFPPLFASRRPARTTTELRRARGRSPAQTLPARTNRPVIVVSLNLARVMEHELVVVVDIIIVVVVIISMRSE